MPSSLGKESAKQFLRMYNAPVASRSLQATGKHLLDTSRAGGVKGYMASMLGGGRMRDLGAAADELERLRKLTGGIPVTGQQAHAQQLRAAASKFDDAAGQVGRDATPALETYNRWAPRVQYGAPAAAVAGGAGYYFGGNSAENDMEQEWANTPIWGRLAAAATGTKSAHVKQALLGTAIRGGGQVIKGIFGGAAKGLVGGAKALGGGLLQSVKNTGAAWKARGARLMGRGPKAAPKPTRAQLEAQYAGQSDWTKPVEALGSSSWKLPVYAGATATPFAAYTANQLSDDPRSNVLDSTYQGFAHNMLPAAGNAIGYGWNKGWDIAGNPGAYWDAARQNTREAMNTASDVWQNRDSMGNAIPNLVNYGQQMWKGASISQKQGVVSNIMTAAEHNDLALQMVKAANPWKSVIKPVWNTASRMWAQRGKVRPSAMMLGKTDPVANPAFTWGEFAKNVGQTARQGYGQMHAGWRYGIPAAGAAGATQGYNSYVDAQKRDFLANIPLHKRLGAALSFTLNPQAAANRLF